MKSFYDHHNAKLNACLLTEETHYEYENPITNRLSASSSSAASTSATPGKANNLGLNNNFMNRANVTQIDDSSGYDTLQRPFKHDAQRGRWSSTVDFYFACTSHAFGVNIFTEVPVYALIMARGAFFPTYFVAILLYTLPIFSIQTFLGQFSSSGAISAFRVVPLFKGIGYSILLLNLCMLSYCAVVAAVPLVYATNSFHSVLPWMTCDNSWNTPNCSTHTSFDENVTELPSHATPEFFRAMIRTVHDGATDYSLNLMIFYGVIAVWLLVLGVLLKHTSFIGKVLRGLCIVMLLIFFSIFLQLRYHEEHSMTDILYKYFIGPPLIINFDLLPSALYMAFWPLGLCWGNVLTLASYNHFRRDSEKLTYWIVGTHVVLAILVTICGTIALDHFEDHVGFFHYHYDEDHTLDMIFVCYAYLFGSLETFPNVWSFLFFSMLFLAELSGIIVQMMTVLTALFDEFERLRTVKTRVTIGIVTLMFASSVFFCTQQGFHIGSLLPMVAVFTNVIISLVLILVSTWIYGRKRFQCDLQFMLGKTISKFKIFLIRFITPLFIAAIIYQIVIFFHILDKTPSIFAIVTQSIIYLMPPAYMIYKLCHSSSGSTINRLKKLLKPQDWYPYDADNRRFYEEIMGISEMSVLGQTEI